ncbi:MAG: PilC/PilY family type IV pilus protein [Methylococcaceae bacterium]
MKTFKHERYPILTSFLATLWLTLVIGLSANISYAAIATSPLFLTTSVTPVVMLNVSKDQQLYFKAYDDYSDLNNDGNPDTTYENGTDYYGYFDSYKCYSYVNSEFEPILPTLDHYCTVGLWSGNFLNWASMARIDTIRKILYGGLRSIDLGSTGATSTSTSSTTPVVTTVVTNPVSTVGPTTVPTTVTPAPTTPAGTNLTATSTGSTAALALTNACTAAAHNLPSATGPTVSAGSSTGPTTTYSTPSTASATTNDPGFPASTVNGITTITNNSSTTKVLTYPDVGGHHAQATTVSSTSSIATTVTPTIGACTSTSHSSSGSDPNKYSNTVAVTVINNTSKTTTTNTTTTIVTTATQTATNTTSTTYATTTINNGNTVLERTYIPNDAHSFAKFYKSPDEDPAELSKLTPYTSGSGITLCNTTVSSTPLSQNVTDAPLLRVAKGDFSLWSANERWQCRWSQEKTASNGNVTASSGLSASANNPSNSNSGSGDFILRVKVCVNGLINKENCKTYPDGTIKPIGLLQTYGDSDLIHFGLMTGSYGKNKSGGVLRKNISSITDEINETTNGTFKSTPSTGGIINTLNLLRIHGYRHDDGTYFGITGSDNCTWGLNTFTNSMCSNWGNPQSEIFLESLRYLSNHSALSDYSTTTAIESSYIPGLSVATHNNPPINVTEWCAKLNVIQFNASTSSYDGDQLANVADISTTAMNALTNTVGVGEGIPGHSYFVGENGTNNNQLCTAKTVNNLSDVKGTCPDAPRLSGTYHIAGLAQFAHNNDIQLGLQGNQLVTTYGVALAPKIPKIVIPVPGSATKTVTILPACQDSSVGGNCTIVDFKIVHQNCSLLTPPPSGTWNCGKIYVNWDDSEQGGDFDMDMWGVLTYSVSSSQVKITTQTIYQSTPYSMGFGYILSGTDHDGFHAHSGIEGYVYNDPSPGTFVSGLTTTGTTSTSQTTAYCHPCGTSGTNYLGPPDETATTVSYNIGLSSAASLEQPLFYAAKWGGFVDSNSNGIPDLPSEWNSNGRISDGIKIPDNYFYATNPSQLAAALNAAFANVVAASASASAVAANSTRLDTGTQVYQAKFRSTDWSGQLQAYSANTSTGALMPTWEASALIVPAAYGGRNIWTYNPSAVAGLRGVPFLWANLTKDTDTPAPVPFSQQHYLNNLNGVVDTAMGILRLDWLRGGDAKEQKNGGSFRNRTNLLGDIVNSDPVYVGNEDYGYSSLDSSYSAFVDSKISRTPMLYVGANDGMLHGFNASRTGGQEVFAYIPNVVFPELSKLTSPTYNAANNHQYYVDGMSAAGDVNFGGAWHTLLAGTTGAGGDTINNLGGRAVFALDVTNPNAFGASGALWEFTSANKPDGTPNTSTFPGTLHPDGGDLGYTLAQPSVVRMQDGHWAVIVANGYNSDYGHAVLFVLDASTGVVWQKIDVGNCLGNPNGLSSPIAVDTNNDLGVDTVYAGDLCGNLWKFDLSGAAGSWPVPSSPFFVACTTTTCSATDRQPITGKPNVGPVGVAGSDQNGVGLMVYFGAGKYFEIGDNIVGTSPQVQTFYGLWDKGTAITNRASLTVQTIDFEGIATTIGGATTTKPIRVVSKNTVCYADTNTAGCRRFGWALNLLKPVNIAEGERVVSFPLVRRGLVIFATVIPSPDPCESGGKSRLMELDALSGGEFGGAAFDITGDGVVNASDFVMIAGVKHSVSGIDLAIGITKTPAIVASSTVDYKYLSGSTAVMGIVVDTGGGGGSGGFVGSGARRSWQQLK